MHRIYAGVFGSGLGHISRVYAIANKLKSEGSEFQYSSFDEAYDFLKMHNEDALYAPSIGLKWNLGGGFSGKDTFVRAPLSIFSFWRQVWFEAERISSYNPKVVLSDSRLSSLLAAKSRLYPVVTILNQLKILFPPRFRNKKFSSFYERLEGDILGLMWSLSNEVLFPDLPPPYTIGEANIAGIDVSNKVKFTGFMTPSLESTRESLENVRSALQFDGRPVLFIQISGPTPTKSGFIKSAIGAASTLSRQFNLVISKGLPGGSKEPYKLANGAWLYDWCPLKDELFLLSDILVVRSGHTTLSQCIDTAKPAVVVPIYNHSEQIWNAMKFAKLGAGIEIRSEDLTKDTLTKAVEQCHVDQSFKEKVEKLQRVSKRYNGIQEAVDTIKTFL